MKQLTIAASIIATTLLTPTLSHAADELGEKYKSGFTDLFTKNKLSGGIFYFQRERDRIDDGPTGTHKYQSNLNHATSQLSLNYNSGYAWGVLGFDLGGFGAYDLAVDESNPVNEENEFSFLSDSWGDHSTTDGLPDNGVSINNAHLKFRLFDEHVTGKLGLADLNVPGIMGVNWSYQPGAYRGAQIEGLFGNLYLTYAYADKYKAPWFKNLAGFSKAQRTALDNFSEENQIDYIHGLAARYNFSDKTSVTTSLGQSQGYMDSYHFKLAHTFAELGDIATSYQFYGSETSNDDYDGLAWQQALTSAWQMGPYGFRVEGLWTKAEGKLGNYMTRMTRDHGNSAGANEIWWDSRSDWNADNEKAIFAGITRTFDDLVSAPGWSVGVSGAYGWDAEYRWQSNNYSGADEWALNFDVLYTVPQGSLKGTVFKLHYTNYNNDTADDIGSWQYPNMFSSEHDVKFHIMMPLIIIN